VEPQTNIDSKYVRTEVHGGVEIPIVDLSASFSSNLAERRALAAAMERVHERHGFSYIEGHRTPPEQLAEVREQISAFFSLPEEEKLKLHISRSAAQRGFVPLGEESPLYGEHADVKECFDIDLDLPDDDPEVVAQVPFRGKNAWPESLPRYRTVMSRLYADWLGLSERISRLFALSFELPEDFFAERTNKPLSRLRTNKYFAQARPNPDGPIGCGTHTDYGLMSFIWQIDEPGLEIQAKSGEWFEAPIIDGAFALVLGDAAEIWTNGHLQATVHRVINRSGRERLSVAWFDQHNFDCVMQPLAPFVSEQRPPRHEPVTMGAWKNRGFAGIFEYRKASKSAE
jgi:isopenicillin N synthase-like dioxygenase